MGVGVSAWGRAKPLVDEAITTTFRLVRASMLFWRAALPLSCATLCYVAGARVLLGAVHCGQQRGSDTGDNAASAGG